MRLKDYVRYDAVGLAELVHKGEVSPIEIINAALAAIDRINPAVNAAFLVDADLAFDTARQVDTSAPLAGVPFLIKDVNVFVSEWPTTFASRFFSGAQPKGDSEIVTRWREAGLIFLGKSNTPEFAEDAVTETTWRGVTYNPWDKGVTVGGSSGGAAAAVASGMVPVAHGTDVGGSIRIPAACCGLFGLKPTRGLNPVGPHYPEIGAGLNADHIISRSVRDSAALLDVTAGPELAGRYVVRKSVPSYLAALEQPIQNLRIAYIRRAPGGIAVDTEILAAVEDVARQLEALGHHIEPCEFPALVEEDIGSSSLWMMEVAGEVGRRAKELGRGPLCNELEAASWAILQNVQRMTALDLAGARQRAHEVTVAMAQHFRSFHLILTPTLATLPPALGIIDGRSADFEYEAWVKAGRRFAPFSEIFNVTGQPAASLPMSHAKNGLPIGIQLVARQGEDHLLLALSAQLEAADGWLDRHPPIWAGAIDNTEAN
ncbi:amidase [Mesorhizobium australafricanum]|uniref:Indoleacetamide hydrolase n=1 Tax=Mesorhizobium australafricanum TaxID=3072311 RepID=A0ABU4X6T9_9HYPH|nr:amidase [Mesorhizobium sp. VK3E]MDX8443673.1 amidase [Mesorhizobium sp. VK3E]